jgi:hypothetical protein
MLPFPEFSQWQGRSIPEDGVETLSYATSDALNMLMAFAGNNSDSEMQLRGALAQDIRSGLDTAHLRAKISALLDKLASIEQRGVSEDEIWISGYSAVQVALPSEVLEPSNTESIEIDVTDKVFNAKGLMVSSVIASGFIVDRQTAYNVLEQVVDQLSAPDGTAAAFYNAGDAAYLAKMLRHYV